MIAFRLRHVSLAAASLLALAACGRGESGDDTGDGDQAGLALTMAAPMMVDPDLTSRNHAEAALAGGGPPVLALPPFEQGTEAVAAAKAEAEKLNGSTIAAAPGAVGELDPALRDAVTAAQRASAVRGSGKGCGTKADYALAWSLQLPAALPIYPRGHLLEAAGSDLDGCRLRVVRFVSAVDASALIDFYHARARRAGFALRHRAAEDVHQLTGSKGAAEFAVQARKREDGLTEADIVTNGI